MVHGADRSGSGAGGAALAHADRARPLDDAENVGLAQDEIALILDLDLAARPFAVDDAVALLHERGRERALGVALARADGDHLALLRLFLGGIGQEDAAHLLDR